MESVLLYGCEAWTLTSALERSLNGCYTCILRAVLNFKWWQHIPNTDLYGDLPNVGDRVAARRISLEGHCIRHPELPAEKVLLWKPTHGHGRRGRQDTFLDMERCRIGEHRGTEDVHGRLRRLEDLY